MGAFLIGAAHAKRFTGVVLHSIEDAWRCSGAPNDLPVWCSDVLSIVSEWRCYVLRGRGMRCVCYSGDEKAAPADEVCTSPASPLHLP